MKVLQTSALNRLGYSSLQKCLVHLNKSQQLPSFYFNLLKSLYILQTYQCFWILLVVTKETSYILFFISNTEKRSFPPHPPSSRRDFKRAEKERNRSHQLNFVLNLQSRHINSSYLSEKVEVNQIIRARKRFFYRHILHTIYNSYKSTQLPQTCKL